MIIFVNSACQPISMREIERVLHDRIITNSLKHNSGNSHENTYFCVRQRRSCHLAERVAKRCKMFSANQLSDLKTLKILFSCLYLSVFHVLYQLNRISTRNISTVNIIHVRIS